MLIIDNSVTFQRATVETNSEGSQYPVYHTLLSNIGCNLQAEDGKLFPGQYGRTQAEDVFILYVHTEEVTTVLAGDRAIIKGITYTVDKILDPYSTHQEMLLSKATI